MIYRITLFSSGRIAQKIILSVKICMFRRVS